MKKISNFEDVEANEGGEFAKLPSGGYICSITAVEDVSDKEYLKIEYDIADGKYKGWWSNTAERSGFWGGRLIRSYKEKAAGFFKGFTTAVEESNPGYKWDWNENGLVGKEIGLVLAEEEYRKNDGSVGTRIYVAKNTTVDKIRAGKYEVPALKKIAPTLPTMTSISDAEVDGDLPF